MTTNETEWFKPGDRVRFRQTESFYPGYTIIILKDGYYIEGQWVYSSAKDKWHSDTFERVPVSWTTERSIEIYDTIYGEPLTHDERQKRLLEIRMSETASYAQ